jgi:CDP-diacylglycerol--serine O-phosphatidyltransferase
LDKEGCPFFESFPLVIYFPFIIIIFSALRLAKFNNDTRQTDSFIGVPTPAVAMFICSIPLITNWNLQFSHQGFEQFHVILNPFLLCATSLVLSFLLISEIPLFALKFKHFKWKDNEIRFVFLGISLAMLITLQFVGIPLIIIMYIALSVINNMVSPQKSIS